MINFWKCFRVGQKRFCYQTVNAPLVRSAKSNAILLARDGAAVGIGMGQVNRVDSCRLAVTRAGEERARGAVAASDAFFPFADGMLACIEAGATGYLLKDVHGDALLDALRRVSAGEVLAPGPTAAGAGGDHHAAPLPQVDDAGWQLLTGQERRVLLGIGEGRTNKQIAAELYLSERTVEHYEASMLAKLGLRRRTGRRPRPDPRQAARRSGRPVQLHRGRASSRRGVGAADEDRRPGVRARLIQ